MAARRLSVRKIKEVLRLHYEKSFSTRQIAKSLEISRSTIRDYLDRAQRAGLGWPLPSELDEASLEHQLFPSLHAVPQEKRQMPSPEYLHQELKKKGVTLQLLWHEYKEKNPEGYQYSQFCRLYHWLLCFCPARRDDNKNFPPPSFNGFCSWIGRCAPPTERAPPCQRHGKPILRISLMTHSN